MEAREIRKKFLDFFSNRDHKAVSSSSLIPDDPSVLLTTAGMQQFKKYYTGELDARRDFGKPNTASIQKCFRTSDIDSVGDESHLTFFEMLGNFSFGGYFKEEAIRLAHDFIVKEMGLAIDRVTVFDPDKVPSGDWRKEGVPRDDESRRVWEELKIGRIENEGVDVFWGPTGAEGPCGPTTEIYVKNASGESVEIWNIVFNEFYCDKNQKLTRLKTAGVDTGMGLERLAMVVQKKENIFETDLFAPLMKALPENMPERARRIVADHLRGTAFLLSDGVRPANKEAGYILRRLMRRAIVHEYLANQAYKINAEEIFSRIAEIYGEFYPELNLPLIKEIFAEESQKFGQTLTLGLKELQKTRILDASAAFRLYESYGLPYEIIKDPEVGGEKAGLLRREDFDAEFEKHQAKSRAGVGKKFGGHGLILDTGELKAGSEAEAKKATRLHTVTHLLHQALRDVLGETVRQMGSDITSERARFDFVFARKMTPEEIRKVEGIVNEKIAADLPVKFQEMSKTEAEATGALHFFKAKYPDRVKVYYVGREGSDPANAYSKEFCGGPHVSRTGEIGRFRIIKEEAVSAGVRRLRAVVE